MGERKLPSTYFFLLVDIFSLVGEYDSTNIAGGSKWALPCHEKNILEDNVDPGSVKPWLNNLAGVPYKNHVLICATIWLFNIAMGKSPFVMGKSTVNGHFQ